MVAESIQELLYFPLNFVVNLKNCSKKIVFKKKLTGQKVNVGEAVCTDDYKRSKNL